MTSIIEYYIGYYRVIIWYERLPFCLATRSCSSFLRIRIIQTWTHGLRCKKQVCYSVQQEIKRAKWLIEQRAASASRRSPPAGIRSKTLTIVRPREHPLSNYGTLIEFLPDRTCRNGRSAINSTTIRRFHRSIIKVKLPRCSQHSVQRDNNALRVKFFPRYLNTFLFFCSL